MHSKQLELNVKRSVIVPSLDVFPEIGRVSACYFSLSFFFLFFSSSLSKIIVTEVCMMVFVCLFVCLFVRFGGVMGKPKCFFLLTN